MNKIMNKQYLKDAFGWGFVLWLIGYLLSIVLFFMVPTSWIGWIIMPIGIIITAWVLLEKIKGISFWHYALLAIVWPVMAIVLDYLFIVKLLNPTDSYYKLSVYLYYVLTFSLPLLADSVKNRE